ncbi:MAG: SsrA-binding protein SmpB [Verrucomicrobium sp.]|nr:SsrA-binding protein SmpB [Verrucomicrobium sp.]
MGDDVITNRKARHSYQILDTYEAGMALRGTEVKSLRLGRGNLDGAYAKIDKGEIWLHQCDIQPYDKTVHDNHEAKAVRRLLLHKAEIRKLFDQISVQGRTLVPLKIYWKNRKLKVLLGIGVGKNARDKREDIKQAEAKRDLDRTLRRRS